MISALALALCPPPPAIRHTCVVDGDTVWIEGEKIRLAGIDAPEINGRCEYERNLARQARDRLVSLLNSRTIVIERTGTDRYGRTLAYVSGAGEVLVQEGLAKRWRGRREPWC